MKLVGVALVIAVGGGCKSSPNGEDLLNEKRTSLAIVYETVRAKLAANPAPLATDGITDVTVPLKAWNPTADSGNTVMMFDGDLKSLPTPGSGGMGFQKAPSGVEMSYLKFDPTFEFQHIAEWIAQGSSSFYPEHHKDPKDAQALIDRFLGIQYIVVTRAIDFGPPKATEPGKFSPGHIVAEALVYDVKGGAHGGFRFGATNSQSVTVPSTEVERFLTEDMGKHMRLEFDEKLRKLVPGSAGFDELVYGHR